MRGSKVSVVDLIVILRRVGDEMHASLHAGEWGALGCH